MELGYCHSSVLFSKCLIILYYFSIKLVFHFLRVFFYVCSTFLFCDYHKNYNSLCIWGSLLLLFWCGLVIFKLNRLDFYSSSPLIFYCYHFFWVSGYESSFPVSVLVFIPVLEFVCASFPINELIPTFHSAGPMIVKSMSYCLLRKIFISPSYLNDNLAG